jgi:HSP20 family protein
MTLIPWRTKRQDAHEEHEADPRRLAAGGFKSELDRLFESFLRDTADWSDRPSRATPGGLPLDIEETDKQLTVRAEIPGVAADDLKVSINGNSLIIAGEKKESQERREGGYFYQERRFGSFRRDVPLPTAVEPDDVKAEYKDGVLTVTLNKSQEALPKRISIEAN